MTETRWERLKKAAKNNQVVAGALVGGGAGLAFGGIGAVPGAFAGAVVGGVNQWMGDYDPAKPGVQPKADK